MITKFNEVSLTGKKSFVCLCGRRLVRQKKFWQTINPYNKTEDGQIKTGQMIIAELKVERATWKAKVEPCTHAPKDAK